MLIRLAPFMSMNHSRVHCVAKQNALVHIEANKRRINSNLGQFYSLEGVWDCWTERDEVGVKSGKEREGGDTQYRQPMRDAA